MKSKKVKKSIQKIELPSDWYSDYFTIEEHLKHLGKEKWSLYDYKSWLKDRFERGKFSIKSDYWDKRLRAKDEERELFNIIDEGNILYFDSDD